MPALDLEQTPAQDQPASRQSAIRHQIEHAAHLLPSQGPITVFVHHNTLHSFEHLDFDAGVQVGGRTFGCNAYLTEEQYREKLDRGRIRVEDLEAVLQEDLGDEADRLVSIFCTRYSLRLSMLQFSMHTGSTHELRWVVAETDALRRFREEVTYGIRAEMLSDTRKAVLEGPADTAEKRETLDEVLQQFEAPAPQKWTDRTWEAFVLNYLWRVCCDGVQGVERSTDPKASSETPVRHRDVIIAAGGEDPDLPVHETLIRFCAAFLDQGFADWDLPGRELGFFSAFLRQHADGVVPTRWFRALRHECRRLLDAGTKPMDSIEESLSLLGVDESEQEAFITQSLLALRGWAGMVWQLETNAEWAPHPAPRDTLIEFLAIRLVLDRIAIELAARDIPNFNALLAELRTSFRRDYNEQSLSDRLDLRAFTVFQLAQVLGWRPRSLENLAPEQWAVLVKEIELFPSMERRRIYHRAFERKYRNETLDAVIAHNHLTHPQPSSPPLFQVITCIDDREESFRRHLEEICPQCETFGVAGFYGTAMYYRGLGHAHFKPLCPVSIKPSHRVVEEPVYSQAELERQKSAARRRLGKLSHQTHRGSRSFFGGILTALAGSLAVFPLVGRVLFPRATSKIRSWLGRIVETPATELRIEQVPDEDPEGMGFTIGEMADIVEGVVRSSGLAVQYSPLVFVLGHGSTSLNNPHESAYNCGACAGSQGGPNARAFAMMVNDHRVRRILADRGLNIPDSTVFVGGYHDTTNESITFSDLDRLPVSHRNQFEKAIDILTEARVRNAHERCRRFESAPLTMSAEDSLRHVEDRPEDLSQARPEYNHATNALCFVGHRKWSRGLFLDRRAFLASYDQSLDDEDGTILETILRAAIPVCAGISLEYYFSTVDVEGYGCGSKLPHNITSMLGVMAGAASDLRPGLSQQMIEIHEPMRLLFVIETSLAAMTRIIENNEAIARLVRGGWVQLAVFDPVTRHVHRYVRGEFVLYAPHERDIPTVTSSLSWYGGHREHLGFASIVRPGNERQGGEV
ncbi:MAG: DUF2309 domain-containing protein [Planctomycetales bacterium]|nr:DUF2309 domain-containing protein [Planctomycetales bacterium]